MRSYLVAPLLVALAFSAGCTYLHDRLKDTIDVGGAKIVAGPGVKAGIGIGAAKTGFNFGYYRFDKFGFQGRAMGVWEETGVEILAPADHHLEAVWGNKEIFDQVEEFQRVDGVSSRAALFDEELTYPRRRYLTSDGLHLADEGFPGGVLLPPGWLAIGDIQLTFAALAGVEVNFSFYQLVDWFCGWFYIDIAKDDSRNYKPLGPHAKE